VVATDRWDDAILGPQEQIAGHGLCNVRIAPRERIEWLDVHPGDATCRRCRQLWKAQAGRSERPDDDMLEVTAITMVGNALANYVTAGILKYWMPSDPPGSWVVGVLRGTGTLTGNGPEPVQHIIHLDSVQEARVFMAGMNVVTQWAIRERRPR
jgi:hypothetical protein